MLHRLAVRIGFASGFRIQEPAGWLRSGAFGSDLILIPPLGK